MFVRQPRSCGKVRLRGDEGSTIFQKVDLEAGRAGGTAIIYLKEKKGIVRQDTINSAQKLSGETEQASWFKPGGSHERSKYVFLNHSFCRD